jgi:hypothetical protein
MSSARLDSGTNIYFNNYYIQLLILDFKKVKHDSGCFAFIKRNYIVIGIVIVSLLILLAGVAMLVVGLTQKKDGKYYIF